MVGQLEGFVERSGGAWHSDDSDRRAPRRACRSHRFAGAFAAHRRRLQCRCASRRGAHPQLGQVLRSRGAPRVPQARCGGFARGEARRDAEGCMAPHVDTTCDQDSPDSATSSCAGLLSQPPADVPAVRAQASRSSHVVVAEPHGRGCSMRSATEAGVEAAGLGGERSHAAQPSRARSSRRPRSLGREVNHFARGTHVRIQR